MAPVILMARNSHKAAYHALYLTGMEPVYLYPAETEHAFLNGCIQPETVGRELMNHPQAAAVFITSPTYDGVVSDIEGIAEAAHRCGALLIVDEAHGAHFGFHPYFPQSAIRQGADIVIQSVHKTLPSLTQTALLHVSGDLTDREMLRRMLGIYQTSSPSYVLMASIDQCVRMLSGKGGELFDLFSRELKMFWEEAGKLENLEAIRTDDPSRLLLSNIRVDRRLFAMMMRLGIPAGLQASMYNVSNMVLQVGINMIGTVAAASWALSGRLDGFYWATANAAGVAVTNFVGQNYGAGRYDRIRECEKVAMLLFMGVTVGFSILLLLIGPAALRWFSPAPAVQKTTYDIMLAFVPYYFIWAVIEVLSGVLRGAGDAIRPVIITGLGICLLRIVWMFTAFMARPELSVLCFSYPLSWAVTALALIIRYRRGSWLKERPA